MDVEETFLHLLSSADKCSKRIGLHTRALSVLGCRRERYEFWAADESPNVKVSGCRQEPQAYLAGLHGRREP